MALDRFVYWKDKKPTKEEVEQVLVNFMGGCGYVEWKGNYFIITVPGEVSYPLNGIHGSPRRPYIQGERWFEVWITKTNLDVVTRQGDDFTNALAERLAIIFQTWWEGTRDAPDNIHMRADAEVD